ncbi:Dabb family protein [Aquabacter spiritensis]|uniref:Stress responsive alpha/beta barrel protein n=1 Tax=Aquabacter spiritensis TaxID=933073 RepID=A0A4R3LW08_9HYPH|nr:Dabb family protein [Aquabacter spiritensis]TCT04286.1 stress responsive alpha/beta barrel protein [Aquabacter spiritensis]
MIRHIVFVRMREDVDAAEIEAVLAQLAELAGVVPGMTGFVRGRNVSPEHLDRGYSHVFMCDFPDEAARDVYLDHPAHKAAAARLLAVTVGGADGLAVADFAY